MVSPSGFFLPVKLDGVGSESWRDRRGAHRQDNALSTADYRDTRREDWGDAHLTAWLYLVLAHLIADFILQPYKLVQLKRGPVGLTIHSGVHVLVTAVIVAPFLPRWWIVVPLSAIVHYVIDRWKVTTGPTDGPVSLAMFLLDQALHLGALALVVLAAGLPLDGQVGYGSERLVTAMYYAVPYVAATFAGAILVYQIAVAFHTRPDPGALLSLGPRAAGLATRALALSLVLFAAPAWWWVGVVPFAVTWVRQRGAGPLVEAVSGLGFTLAVGLLFR
jgi:hypothetical protein